MADPGTAAGKQHSHTLEVGAEAEARRLDRVWSSYTHPIEPSFHEGPGTRLRRLALGSAYALRLSRASLLPPLTRMTAGYIFGSRKTRDQLPEDPVFLTEYGLIGISNDLGTVLERYRRGFFPICHLGPMKWWSPAQRAVIAPDELRIDRNTRRLLRKERFLVTFDDDFAAVMEACAEPRTGRTPLTWITPRIMHAFWALHEAGYAHSVEIWDEDCKLVGGMYALAIGGVFFAESRFAKSDSASKLGVAVLHHHLDHWGFGLRDAKWMSGHLANLGFRLVDRASFEGLLGEHTNRPGRIGRWEVDESLDTASWLPPAQTQVQ